MAVLRFGIKTYEVLLGKKIGVGFTGLNYATGWISCRGASGEQLLIVFAPTQALVDGSANFTDINAKRGGIVAPMSSFGAYVDLLRNEQPLYGQIDSANPESMNLLISGLETVGEEERVAASVISTV